MVPVFIVGATGVLGGLVIERLVTRGYDGEIVAFGRNREKLINLSAVCSTCYVDLLSVEDEFFKLDDFFEHSVDVVWCVAPELRFQSFNNWVLGGCTAPNSELRMFCAFIEKLKSHKISINKLVVTLSAAMVDPKKARGIWGYISDKRIIKDYASELKLQGRVHQLDFLYPDLFPSKCSADLLRVAGIDDEVDKSSAVQASSQIVDVIYRDCFIV